MEGHDLDRTQVKQVRSWTRDCVCPKGLMVDLQCTKLCGPVGRCSQMIVLWMYSICVFHRTWESFEEKFHEQNYYKN